jgi:hypothetical protein
MNRKPLSKIIIAAFADEYAETFVSGLNELIEEIFRITPALFLIISSEKI